MPRRHSSQPAPLDRPVLVPHAGLPGLDGTRRFAYSMEAAGAARDAFKLLPLLPTPLSGASASSTGGAPGPALVAAAAGGVGALGGGEAAAGVGGASALAGGSSGVQVCSFDFFVWFEEEQKTFSLSLNLSLSFNVIPFYSLPRARPKAGPRPRGRTPRLRRAPERRSENWKRMKKPVLQVLLFTFLPFYLFTVSHQSPLSLRARHEVF